MTNPSNFSDSISPNPSPNDKWWAMLGIGVGVFMLTIDTSIVNIALPTLVKVFKTNFATVQLVVVSYLLVLTALVLGAARLGDMLGKKKLYLIGIIIFTISSLLCGLAPSIWLLIIFRIIQGFGAVFMSGLGPAIITEVFPRSERGRALGIIGAVVSIGIAIGPSIGGLLIGVSGWRTIFLVNVPIGIIATFIVIKFVPFSPITSTRQRFDWLGTVVITLTLTCFIIGMTRGQEQGFGNPISLTLFLMTVISLIAFVVIENKLRQPMLDLSILKNGRLSLSLIAAVIVFIVVGGFVFILPFFLELVLNYTPQQTGLLLAVSPILGGIVAPFSGSLSDRFGQRIISLIGLLLMIVGCLLVSRFNAQLTDLGYILYIAPFGIGFGMFQSPNNSAILGSVSRERLGITSGLLSLSRTLGQTTGVPLLGSIFDSLTQRKVEPGNSFSLTSAPPSALVFGFEKTLILSAIFLLVAAILLVFIGRMKRSS
ncbi:drug resistance transporter, EmrB/QacA subfamily [Gloeothece citriformis PCC 7424]|uniref:Drug resistance transporter, EmrB/QacA subfamily n=1 Tax=Gloeothece citriformis (strain PCC 7424) TaxID=65393 RepID=B7KHY2_GLOC7|nr:MFS transporter [Gloeothece citriformis]ACK72079.1 drug resistance transporter, EmrB/QacA subfamily [Gloeothece citriformis PCC 7424]